MLDTPLIREYASKSNARFSLGAHRERKADRSCAASRWQLHPAGGRKIDLYKAMLLASSCKPGNKAEHLRRSILAPLANEYGEPGGSNPSETQLWGASENSEEVHGALRRRIGCTHNEIVSDCCAINDMLGGVNDTLDSRFSSMVDVIP